MANSNGWGDGASNNLIGWGQGADNAIAWGDSHLKSWAGATDIAGFDSAAISYFNATGISGATQQDAIDNLIRGLKDDGIWSKMKAVYPFVTDNRNLLGYTEDFGNAYWTKQSATVSTNTTTAPNETLTADTSAFSSTVQSFLRASSISINSGQTYTISVYVKKSASSGANNIRITTNDTIAWNTGISQKFALTNSWQRITLTGVLTSSVNVCHIIFGSTGIDGNVDATCGGNVDMWGAQLELGSTATTYQPIATTQQAFIANQFKYNLVNPLDTDAAFRLVFNGGWTHSSTGATPNGTNGYADTKFVPNTQLTLNSASFSAYSRNNLTFAVDQSLGCSSIATNLPLFAQTFTTLKVVNSYMYSYNVPDIMTSSSGQNLAAMFITTRTAANNAKSFRNTTQLAAVTTQAQTTQPTNNFFFGAFNGGTGISNYSNFQYAFSHIGDGLTDTEAANLYNRVQAFQTALNRQV
jgi:hypothetical protein